MKRALVFPMLGLLLGACNTTMVVPATKEKEISAQGCTYSLSYTPASYKTGFTSEANPNSGLYEWFGTEFNPITPSGQQHHAAKVNYRRYSWDSFYNFSTGQYDFSWLGTVIGWARTRGQKLAFRIQPMGDPLESDPANRSYLPTHVEPYSTRVTYPSTGTPQVDVVVPNWNDPTFLALYHDFYQKLREYLIQTNSAKDIAFVDIGTYGFWGEWHLWTGTPAVLPEATPDTQKKLVDIVTDHLMGLGFPLVMMSDGKDALPYALAKSSEIGWRRDSLGWDHFSGGLSSNHDAAFIENTLKTRHLTAPVVAEFAQVLNQPGRDRPNFFTRALNDVKAYHITTVSNGNTTLSWANLTSTEQAQVNTIHKTAGLWPKLLKSMVATNCTDQLNVTLSLQNTGNAPAYENWNATYLLQNTGGKTFTLPATTLDLRNWNPASSKDVLNTLTLPGTLSSGKYKLYVTFKDSQNVLPLPLVMAGPTRDSAGKLLLGTVNLSRLVP